MKWSRVSRQKYIVKERGRQNRPREGDVDHFCERLDAAIEMVKREAKLASIAELE